MPQIQNSDIVLFSDHESHVTGHKKNILKNFLLFLNSTGAKRPYKFAHIPAEGLLIPHLTLKKNLLLDSISQGFETSIDQAYEKRLLAEQNPHLKNLLETMSTEELEQLPKDVSAEKQKTLSLVKALLQQSNYLFLECPEKHLSSLNLEMLILAMEHNSKERGQIIMISSPHAEVWKNICTKMVSRDEKKRFQVRPVITEVESGHKEDRPYNRTRRTEYGPAKKIA